MKTIPSIAFTLALGLASIASAASLSYVENALQIQSQPEAVPRPEPAELEANWWHFFEVEGEELDRRVTETSKRLETFLAALPEKTAAAAQPFVKRIQANLQALVQARKQSTPTPPPPLAYAETYSISQLLDIVKQLAGERPELQAERTDVASLERTIKAAHRRIDTLLAAYLGLAPRDPQRVLRGLEIMAERSAVALAEEQLRLKTAALMAHETLIQQLSNEQAIAVNRLVAGKGDLGRLDAEIEKARSILEQAQERSIKERSKVLSVLAGEPQAKIIALYRQQREVHAEVLEGIAMVRLIRFAAERFLASLLLNAADADAHALRGQLAEWEAQLTDIRRQAVTWSENSEQERRRVSELLAGVFERAGATPSMFNITNLLNQDRLEAAQKTLVALQGLEIELSQADLLVELLDRELLSMEGKVWDWLSRGELALRRFLDSMSEWVNQSLFKIGNIPVTALGLLQVALILFIAWWTSHWLRHALNRLLDQRKDFNRSTFYMIGRLSHYTILILGFLVGLASIGVDFTNFALVAAAMAIGIGFGLQSLVSNFISGLILFFEHSLKVGDFIELDSGIAGEVREINVRSTRINTNDNVDIVVPNSDFMRTKVINWTLEEDYRRIHISFRVAYGTDIDLVTQAAMKAAERVPHTLTTRKPGVWLVDFGESCLNFELVVWITPEAVKRPGAVNAAYKREIAIVLCEYGIEVPYPQRDLHLRTGFEEILQPNPHSLSTQRPSEKKRRPPVQPDQITLVGKKKTAAKELPDGQEEPAS